MLWMFVVDVMDFMQLKQVAGHSPAGQALPDTPLGGATFTGSKSFGPMFAGLGLLISLVVTASCLVCSIADMSALQQAAHPTTARQEH
jgi:hypothetical protein